MRTRERVMIRRVELVVKFSVTGHYNYLLEQQYNYTPILGEEGTYFYIFF